MTITPRTCVYRPSIPFIFLGNQPLPFVRHLDFTDSESRHRTRLPPCPPSAARVPSPLRAVRCSLSLSLFSSFRVYTRVYDITTISFRPRLADLFFTAHRMHVRLTLLRPPTARARARAVIKNSPIHLQAYYNTRRRITVHVVGLRHNGVKVTTLEPLVAARKHEFASLSGHAIVRRTELILVMWCARKY
jgi:hypothetical protein